MGMRLVELMLTLVWVILLGALALRFVRWRGRRLSAHLYHWWVVRRGTRRMLQRAERVHAGGLEQSAPGVKARSESGERTLVPSGQPETVILPPRAERAGPMDLPDSPAWTTRLDPKRARAEAEAQGLRIVSPSEGPDVLAGWLLNVIGLSILIILGLWLVNGGYWVVLGLLPF
jgi:hypothetical protein